MKLRVLWEYVIQNPCASINSPKPSCRDKCFFSLLLEAEEIYLVAIDITCCYEQIMHTAGILHDCQDRPPLVGQKLVADTRYKPQNTRSCVFHAHQLL